MFDASDYNLVFRFEKQAVSTSITQVYLELSTHCNLSCRSCVRNSIVDLKKSHFSPAMMRRLLPMLGELELDRIVLLGFGEALCNPRIKKLLASLRELDTRIVLVTNAAFLSESMSAYLVALPLDEIWVSWDDDIEGGTTMIRQGMQAGLFRRNIEALLGKKSAARGGRPLIGMQIIATRINYQFIPGALAYGHSIGIEKFIVSNLFPYTDQMKHETLYEVGLRPRINLSKYLRHVKKKFDMVIANQMTDKLRRCPFIEKGSVFITANGEVSPCPELAYTHPAFYFGRSRMHNRFITGSIKKQTLESIWSEKKFSEMRNNFLYYDYPDCSYCFRPDMCYHRTVDAIDCFWNPTPCGECLWAKDIILCP